MKRDWFSEAFGQAVASIRDRAILDAWFGPHHDPAATNLWGMRDDQAKSDLGWTRDDQAKPEHYKDAQSPETSREQSRGIDR